MLKWWQCPNDNRHVLEARPRWSENLYCKFCENTRAIFSDKAEILRARLAEVERERELIAKTLRFEVEDGEYFIPAEPGPLGPFTLTEAVQNWMELVDKWDAEDRACVELLEKALERLLSGAERYMACKPWRDADECFSEARAALHTGEGEEKGK